MFSMLYTINQELSVRKGVDCWWYIIPQFVFHRMAILYTAFTIYTTKLQMALMRDNTLKSNLVSFTGSSVEKLDILLPLIFHPSFGLSVVLGTRRKAGGWGWSGVRETVKRLLNYSLLSVKSAEWENCPKEKKREAQEATDSWLGWFVLLVYTAQSHKPPLSMKYNWTKPIIAPCHAQSHEIGVLKLLYAAFMLSVFCALFLSCLVFLSD